MWPRSPADGDPSAPDDSTVDADALDRALALLGPPEEAVVRLKHYDDLSFVEIGRLLEIPVNTVKSRYYRGLRWLRARLAPSSEEVV